MFSKWYSWGSPVGLGISLISIAIAVLIVTYAVTNVTDTWQKGVDIEEQPRVDMREY